MWSLLGKAAIPAAKFGWNVVAPAAMVGSTGLAVGDAASNWAPGRKKEINQMTDSEFESFNPSLIDRHLLGVGTKEEAGARRDSYTTDKALNSKEITALRTYVPDFQYEVGDDAGDIQVKNAEALRKARRKITKAENLDDYNTQYYSQGAIDERNLAKQTRQDTLRQNAELRADNQQARLDEIEYRRLRDQKEDRRYNENIMRMNTQDRRQAMSSLGAGLAALGAAFAL